MAGTNAGIKEKVGGLINNVRYYWNEPPKGRYMTFKEIVSYAGGGIGCYFIILFGTQLSTMKAITRMCILSATPKARTAF